jgi:hypothetical protein
MNEQVLRMTNCTQLFSSLKLRPGEGMAQEGDGGAGSTLAGVPTRVAHRNNDTRRRRSDVWVF